MKIKELLQKDLNNEQKLALEQVLNLSRPEIIINKEKELTEEEYKEYKRINEELEKGKPIQYILNKANFYGNDFYINNNVLIPRPETEVLIEKTNNLIKKHFNKNNINIIDIGTGSGVIAITLKLLNKNYNITATDISKEAITVARENCKKHSTDIKLVNTNLYEGINDRFDVVISNPPYIDINSNQIEQKVKENEPHLALFAKKEGLYYYEKILSNIKDILTKNYIIAFEIGENQGKKIERIANKYLNNAKIEVQKDYNGYDRYIFIIGKNE